MKKLKWLVQFSVYALLGAWFYTNPGSITFDWIGYEGHTSVAFMLAVLVVCWTLWDVMHRARETLSRFWGRLWGRVLPFDIAPLLDRRFKHMLYNGGVYQVRWKPWDSTPSMLSPQHVQGQKAYCQHLLQNHATAWWGYWGLIQLWCQQGDVAQAHTWARKAHEAYPRHKEMTHMYAMVCALHGDEEAILKLASLLRRQGVCSQAQERRLIAHVRLMQVQRQRREAEENATALETLENITRLDSTFEPALRVWCARLRDAHQGEALIKHIRKRWPQSSSVPLGLMYLDALGFRSVERFKAAYALTERGGRQDVRDALLGIEAFRAGLLRDARHYIQLLNDRGRHPFFIKLLQRVDEEEHALQKGVFPDAERVLPPLEEGPWVCPVCTHGMDGTYDASCAACGLTTDLAWLFHHDPHLPPSTSSFLTHQAPPALSPQHTTGSVASWTV